MDSAGRKDQCSFEDLETRIRDYLFSALRTLHSLHLDISVYLLHHNAQNVHRDPLSGNGLDDLYTMYEERANECRRLWMKVRAVSEQRTSTTRAADSFPSGSRSDLETSLSPLKYQSAPCEDEPAGPRRNDQVTPMDVDPVKVEQDLPRLPTPAADPHPPKPKTKKGDVPTPRGVIITPSGPTSCRLAPIPKGVKLSIETTRFPAPRKPFTFDMPKQPIINHSERPPLNRTKRNRRNSPKNTPPHSSSQSSSQEAGPSTAQTSVSVSPRRNYSSAKEYWEPRRAIRPIDFQMDDDRLFNSLDCLGPPFQVNMTHITHNDLPATQTDLRTIYGGKLGITPKITPEMLANHGFDRWMTPNMDFHPFLPARPGWPGLMLRLDDELEEWCPEEGTEFRVVIKREPRFIEYVGQYEMVRLGDITGDEWKRQSPKVKKRWPQVLGGGQSWYDTVVRVALRNKLEKEPSVKDFTKFAERLTASDYAALAKELKDDIDRAFCKGEEVIAVWGMKCVGYDFKFEKHLARSVRAIKPSSSSESAGKRKTVTWNDDVMNEDEDEGKGEDSASDGSPPPKRQRIAKGKAKLVKYDWSDARFQGDSEDEDYKPT